MREKRLAGGEVAYYWEPQHRDLAKGCSVHAEALGEDYGAAVRRATFLNENLDAWRSGQGAKVESSQRLYGTVSWLFDRYFKSPAFEKRVGARSRYEYHRALARIEDIPTTTGRTVAALPASSITPAAVDKIYSKLQLGPRGPRVRQANLSVDIARRAWDVVRRLNPAMVPAENPWRGVLRNTTKRAKVAATRAEAYAIAEALKAIGEPHLGIAALICFEWLQRPENVLEGKITWSDVRPADHPNHVRILHHKTGEIVWMPLQDEAGLLFPELETILRDLPRLGLPIVLTAGRRGPARPYAKAYAQRRVREARNLASLESHVTLDACRHGGMTELGDAELTEQGVMTLSGHRTPQAARLYVKRTEHQRVVAARKRRQWVVENELRTKVGIEQRPRSRNEIG